MMNRENAWKILWSQLTHLFMIFMIERSRLMIFTVEWGLVRKCLVLSLITRIENCLHSDCLKSRCCGPAEELVPSGVARELSPSQLTTDHRGPGSLQLNSTPWYTWLRLCIPLPCHIRDWFRVWGHATTLLSIVHFQITLSYNTLNTLYNAHK